MTVLVTGSSGHLGEAVLRLLAGAGRAAVGLDTRPGLMTNLLGSIADRAVLQRAFDGATAVIHCATLHKPHVATHTMQEFIDTNIAGTLALLEQAVRTDVGAFVFTSTTSAFGDALRPPAGAPAAWIENVINGAPKNIYGVTKTSAEDLCALFHRKHGLPVIVLRTARFFPEPDDSAEVRAGFADANAKANEFLFRRVDLHDAATAHLAALDRAAALGWGRYVISATTPFRPADCARLRSDAAGVLQIRVPETDAVYATAGFRMFPGIDRVYSNARALHDLGWEPAHDFRRILAQIACGQPLGSPLARQVGIKGYHGADYADGLYPVEPG